MMSALAYLNIDYAEGNFPPNRNITVKSDSEALQILSNPKNQQKVELYMYVLKSIQDLGITDIDKKIAFVETMEVSNNIKDWVKSSIRHNINYSDYKKVSYGIYQTLNNKCGKGSNPQAKLSDYIPFRGHCAPLQWYEC